MPTTYIRSALLDLSGTAASLRVKNENRSCGAADVSEVCMH